MVSHGEESTASATSRHTSLLIEIEWEKGTEEYDAGRPSLDDREVNFSESYQASFIGTICNLFQP